MYRHLFAACLAWSALAACAAARPPQLPLDPTVNCAPPTTGKLLFGVGVNSDEGIGGIHHDLRSNLTLPTCSRDCPSMTDCLLRGVHPAFAILRSWPFCPCAPASPPAPEGLLKPLPTGGIIGGVFFETDDNYSRPSIWQQLCEQAVPGVCFDVDCSRGSTRVHGVFQLGCIGLKVEMKDGHGMLELSLSAGSRSSPHDVQSAHNDEVIRVIEMMNSAYLHQCGAEEASEPK